MVGRFAFNTTENMVGIIVNTFSSSESNYDYGIISELDTTLSSSNSVDSTNAFAKFYGVTGYRSTFIPLTGAAAGSHFITAKYRTDGSGTCGFDTFVIMSICPVYAYSTKSL